MISTAAQYQGPPSTGGRVELRRLDEARTPSAVLYEARWTTPQGAWEGQLTIEPGPQVTPTFHGEPPPSWLAEWTTQLLRTKARSVAHDPAAAWPRRLTRWRAAPDER